ncbi:hypothetical protein MMMDOFMJ_4316 [Methylobacterium gnaphalii]|nr:hypothetical protein MMMDOFMJ_4316 [Methylobacterium gnaphalii]
MGCHAAVGGLVLIVRGAERALPLHLPLGALDVPIEGRELGGDCVIALCLGLGQATVLARSQIEHGLRLLHEVGALLAKYLDVHG